MSKPICEHYVNPCFRNSYDRESDYDQKSSCYESRCCKKPSCREPSCRKRSDCYVSSCCEPCCGGPFFTFPNFFTVIPPVVENGG